MPFRTATAARLHDDLLEALRESEERLRLVVQNAPVVFWAVDRNGVFTFLEGRGLSALGPRARARVGESVFDVYAGDPVTQRNTRRVLDGEEFTDVQEVDGVVFETHFTPLRDTNGSVVGAMGVSNDVTERRRAEEELREREARFENVFHVSPDAIAINRAADGCYVDVNERFLELTGCRRPEVIGATPAELGIWMKEDELEAVLTELRGKGQVRDVQVEIQSRSGRNRVVLFSATRMEVRGEACVLSFLHDVTEHREAERALLEVSARLLRSQDEERRRIARELHDSTAQSLAGAALSFAAVARVERTLPKATRRALAEGLALVEDCSRQIRTLSYLLHPPMLDEVGLVGAIRDYVDGFSVRSGIQVELDLPARRQRLTHEVELTLFRIVQEALTNIHRHSRSASAWIAFSRSGQTLLLEVGDAGRGMPEAVLKRTRGEGAVVGVGIPGMRERLRQLGGRLEITSSDRGTTVRAIVPEPRKRT